MAATFLISITSHEAIVDDYKFLPQPPFYSFLSSDRTSARQDSLPSRMTQTFISEASQSSVVLPLFSCNSMHQYLLWSMEVSSYTPEDLGSGIILPAPSFPWLSGWINTIGKVTLFFAHWFQGKKSTKWPGGSLNSQFNETTWWTLMEAYVFWESRPPIQRAQCWRGRKQNFGKWVR